MKPPRLRGLFLCIEAAALIYKPVQVRIFESYSVMFKTLSWVVFAIIVVVAGFQYQYESLDPCEWMTQEIALTAGIPGVSGFGSTAGAILSKGECLQNWMDLRVKGAESK